MALSLAWVAAIIDPNNEDARWLTASAWDRLLKNQGNRSGMEHKSRSTTTPLGNSMNFKKETAMRMYIWLVLLLPVSAYGQNSWNTADQALKATIDAEQALQDARIDALEADPGVDDKDTIDRCLWDGCEHLLPDNNLDMSKARMWKQPRWTAWMFDPLDGYLGWLQDVIIEDIHAWPRSLNMLVMVAIEDINCTNADCVNDGDSWDGNFYPAVSANSDELSFGLHGTENDYFQLVYAAGSGCAGTPVGMIQKSWNGDDIKNTTSWSRYSRVTQNYATGEIYACKRNHAECSILDQSLEGGVYDILEGNPVTYVLRQTCSMNVDTGSRPDLNRLLYSAEHIATRNTILPYGIQPYFDGHLVDP